MTHLQAIKKLESVMNHVKLETSRWPWSPAIWQGVYEIDRLYRERKYGPRCSVCQELRTSPGICDSCKYYRRDGKFRG